MNILSVMLIGFAAVPATLCIGGDIEDIAHAGPASAGGNGGRLGGQRSTSGKDGQHGIEATGMDIGHGQH